MATDSSPRSSRLLIIDDSANIHDDIRKILATEKTSAISQLEVDLFGETAPVGNARIQFTIDSAYQGDDGVAMLATALGEHAPYAVAFVDMRMPPGLDGLGTVEKLWQLDPALQVVICSAYSDYSWSEIVHRLGRNDRLVILRKPFDNIEVMQLAHTLAEKWSLQQQVQAQMRLLEAQVKHGDISRAANSALFRLVSDRSDKLIIVVDASYRRIYESPSYTRQLGYSVEETASGPAFDAIHPDDLPLLTAVLAKAAAGNSVEKLILRRQHRNGGYSRFETEVHALHDKEVGRFFLLIGAPLSENS